MDMNNAKVVVLSFIFFWFTQVQAMDKQPVFGTLLAQSTQQSSVISAQKANKALMPQLYEHISKGESTQFRWLVASFDKRDKKSLKLLRESSKEQQARYIGCHREVYRQMYWFPNSNSTLCALDLMTISGGICAAGAAVAAMVYGKTTPIIVIAASSVLSLAGKLMRSHVYGKVVELGRKEEEQMLIQESIKNRLNTKTKD